MSSADERPMVAGAADTGKDGYISVEEAYQSAFSPAGALLASASADKTIRLWH